MKTPLRFAIASAYALTLTSSGAATLTNITSNGVAIGDVDLTEVGTTNWAAWDVRVSSTSSSIAPTQFKESGNGTISSISPFGDSAVRGTTSYSIYTDTFTWTTPDENSNTAAPSDGRLSGIFNSNLDTIGNGVSFNITDLATLTGGQYYQINVYTSTFRGTGKFNADINGGTAITQLGLEHDTTKNTDYFSIAYNPDDISDSLNISYELFSKTTAGSSHTVIQAVGISIVPEPSCYALIAGALAFFCIAHSQGRKVRN